MLMGERNQIFITQHGLLRSGFIERPEGEVQVPQGLKAALPLDGDGTPEGVP